MYVYVYTYRVLGLAKNGRRTSGKVVHPNANEA